MKLCVLANLYGAKPLDEALAKLKSLGVEAVEIGAGGYPGKAHCNPAELLADEKKLEEFNNWVESEFNRYMAEMYASVRDLKINDNASIPFCLQAIQAIRNSDEDYSHLDDLIIRRERLIKRTRSKIGSDAYEYRPEFPIHNYTIQFRWETVRTLIGEIYKGLENG